MKLFCFMVVVVIVVIVVVVVFVVFVVFVVDDVVVDAIVLNVDVVV